MATGQARRGQVRAGRFARCAGAALFFLALLLALTESTLMRADPAGAGHMARAIHATHAAHGAPATDVAMPRHARAEGAQDTLHAAAATQHDCAGGESGAEVPMRAHMGGLCCPLACAGLAAQMALVAAPSGAPAASARIDPASAPVGRTLEPPTPPPRTA